MEDDDESPRPATEAPMWLVLLVGTVFWFLPFFIMWLRS